MVLISAALFWDTPYRLGYEKWDVAITGEQWETIFKNFNSVNTCKNHCVFFYVGWKYRPFVLAALTAAGYKDMHSYYWIKTNQSVEGFRRYTYAVEELLFGYSLSMQKAKWTNHAPTNPIERCNWFSCPSVTTLYKCPQDGEILNIHEKPPEVARHILSWHCTPDDTVLIIGAGSGEMLSAPCELF